MLSIYDPKVGSAQICKDLEIESSHPNVEFATSAAQAAVGAHALLVLTEWDEFREVDFKAVHQSMMKPAWLFDGRNVLDHELLRQTGFRVRAIGKDPTPSSSTCSWTA